MYTVKELLEALQQCPEDYQVRIIDNEGFYLEISTIGIDIKNQTVDLFIQ